MTSKCLSLVFAVLIGTTAFGGAASARTFKCQDKGSMNFGTCKTLGNGRCSITVGDGTTVKMPCKDLRRL